MSDPMPETAPPPTAPPAPDRAVTRSDLTVMVEGTPVAVWWYEPDGPSGEGGAAPGPAVVMAHGLAGVRQGELDRYARRFAAEGLRVALFDYRTFGDSGGWPRQVLSVAGQQADWRAVIAAVRGKPGVDADRVGLWGSSFSGGHVQALAAEDGRVGAVVAQAPLADARADPAPLAHTLRLVRAMLRDKAREARGKAPYYIGVSGHPGDLAVMVTPDALGEGTRLQPADGDTTWENRLAARSLWEMKDFRPALASADIRAPVLYALADRDLVTPVEPVLEAAARAPRSEVVRYPIGHFEIYRDPWFSRVAGEQAAFFAKHLGA